MRLIDIQPAQCQDLANAKSGCSIRQNQGAMHAVEIRENFNALREALRSLGYVEGQNLDIVYRSADGRDERLMSYAAPAPPFQKC